MLMEAVLERGKLELISSEYIWRILCLILIGNLFLFIIWTADTMRFEEKDASGMIEGMRTPEMPVVDRTKMIALSVVSSEPLSDRVTAVSDRISGENNIVTVTDDGKDISKGISDNMTVNTRTVILTDSLENIVVNTSTTISTDIPVNTPTDNLTEVPANTPSDIPANTPSDVPANTPSDIPVNIPTDISTDTPTDIPTEVPTEEPEATVKVIKGFTVNESGCITGYQDPLVARSGILSLPEDEFCTSVGSRVFAGLEDICTEIYIPANITSIEPDAFMELSNVFYVEVAPDNPNYYSECGILYNTDGELVYYPLAR